MTGKYVDEFKKNLYKNSWVKPGPVEPTQFLHWRDKSQSGQIPLQSLPSFTSIFSIHSSALCLKVPPVYRWLLEYRFKPHPPIPSADPTWLMARAYTRAWGSCLKSVFDVFLHTAQVRQASAARLVSEQSDLTHVDSSVHLTSQSRERI